MIVLGIESSCDETAAALVQDGNSILSSIVASQIPVHASFGGVVPELASREHVENICFVVRRCLEEAGRSQSLDWKDIDGIAVTRGPGLVGALLVGLTYAKGLAFTLGVPLVGVNHLEGHIHSVFLDHPGAELPALSLVVSGGHTSIFYVSARNDYREISKTRDDAAGEALDKLAKLLGLGYPGGPVIDRLAPHGNPRAVPFALPKFTDRSLAFSFSGIKTAALRHVQQNNLQPIETSLTEDPGCIPQPLLDLVASYQDSIIHQLLDQLDRALQGREARSIHLSGGVSSNSALRRKSKVFFKKRDLPVYYPRLDLTTDNAAMIGAAGTLKIQAGITDSWDLTAEPNLATKGFPLSP